MMIVEGTFKIVRLKPQWCQLAIDQLHIMLLGIGLLIAYAMTNFLFHELLAVLSAVCMLFLAVKTIALARTEYIITGEQIIYQHGIISHQTDYMELYRVVDYQQHRTLLQQLTGLKNISIMSGDRNMPVLTMVGLPQKQDVVHEIRKRVEFNKKMKSIYEITNRI